jgi:glutaredoxin-like protein
MTELSAPSGGGTGQGDDPTVTVYWRRGCPYCASLRRGLRKAGLATVEIDIWSEPAAAAFVWDHAGGNETVPTVDVGGTVLVNPSARTVIGIAQDAGIATGGPSGGWLRRRRN